MRVRIPPARPPLALLFDLDGTLVDSRADIAASLNAAREAFGRAPLPLPEVVAMVGDGARSLVARGFGVGPDDPLVPRALDAFRAHYEAHPCDATSMLPGVEAALALDVPAALVTNKPRRVTLLLLEALGILPRFRAIVAGDDAPLKPAPDGVFSACMVLGVAAEDAWMIGDGPQDVGAGRAAGAYTVGVRGVIADGERLEAARPDAILDDLTELPALRATV